MASQDRSVSREYCGKGRAYSGALAVWGIRTAGHRHCRDHSGDNEAKLKKSLADQIESTAASLRAAKPRSVQRIKLEFRLRDLVTKALKLEIRMGKKAA